MNKKALSADEALRRMAALCSTGEHCVSDVRERLHRAAINADDAEAIITRLREEGFINEARFCRAFARDRLRFDHWGRMKIAQALHMKGLSEADIRQAIDDMDEELGDEYRRTLQDTLAQKSRTLHDEDDYTRRAKLMRCAAARGFTADEIIEAMNEA